VKRQKERRLVFLLVGLGLAAVPAFFLRETTRDYLILPLARLAWLARGYYASLPQTTYYVLLLIAIGLIGMGSFRIADVGNWRRHAKRDEPGGEVWQTAFWFERARHSLYARWYVAHALADLALDLLGKRHAGGRRNQTLEGPGWAPPPGVHAYLQAALRMSPASFSRRVPSSDAASLLQDPAPAVAYLETIMEDNDEP
jgi:hypothetical protein